VAILPAGTANLLAKNLQIPDDITEAVRIGLHGDRRRREMRIKARPRSITICVPASAPAVVRSR
jgi:hypothetical protein